jgi:hypothetical protein
MALSALLGEPPATHDDALVYKALMMLNGTGYFKPPTEYRNKNRPPDDFNGTPMIAAISFLMGCVIFFTAARVWAQQYRKKHHIAFWISNVFLFFSAVCYFFLLRR